MLLVVGGVQPPTWSRKAGLESICCIMACMAGFCIMLSVVSMSGTAPPMGPPPMAPSPPMPAYGLGKPPVAP